MLLWYVVYKDINKVDILYFLRRSLFFANNKENKDKIVEVSVNVDIIARILATFFSYFFINLEISSKSLILYYQLYLKLYFFYLIKYSIIKLYSFLIIRLLNNRLISKLIVLLLLIEINKIY